jgi:hypothetical protein
LTQSQSSEEQLSLEIFGEAWYHLFLLQPGLKVTFSVYSLSFIGQSLPAGGVSSGRHMCWFCKVALGFGPAIKGFHTGKLHYTPEPGASCL